MENKEKEGRTKIDNSSNSSSGIPSDQINPSKGEIHPSGRFAISQQVGNYKIEAEGAPEIRISKDELSMLQEGTIPSKIAALLAQAGIPEEELIRTAQEKIDAIRTEADFYLFLDRCKSKGIYSIKDRLQELEQLDVSSEMKQKIVKHFEGDARNNKFDLKALEKFKKASPTMADDIYFPGPIHIVEALTEKYRLRTIPEIGSDKEQVWYFNGQINERAEEKIKAEAHAEYIRQWKEMLDSAPNDKGLTAKLRGALHNGPSANQINEVLAMIRRTTFTHEEMNPSGYIPFRNGLLNIQTRKLEPFTPDLFITYQVNASLLDKYVTMKDIPMFSNLLNTVFFKVDIPMVLSYFAYSFSPDFPVHKVLFVLGRERIGKGTSVRVLQGMMPKGSGSMSLARLLTSDRFQFTGIEGKNLLVDSETKRKFKRGTVLEWSVFCNLFGKDVLSIEPKGHEAHDYVSKAKGIFLGNLPFIPVDSPPAISRILLAVTRDERPKTVIPDLDIKILDSERDQIATLLMQILFRLMDHSFIFPGLPDQRSDEATAQLLEKLADPVENFIEEETEYDGESAVPVDDAYSRFLKWCKGKGIPTIARQTFVKKFGRTYPKKILGPRGKRAYFFTNCNLDTEGMETSPENADQVDHGIDRKETLKIRDFENDDTRDQHASHDPSHVREQNDDHDHTHDMKVEGHKLITLSYVSGSPENKGLPETKGVINLIGNSEEPLPGDRQELQNRPVNSDVPKQNPLYSMVLDILIRLSSLSGKSRIDPQEIMEAWPSTSPIPCPGWNDLTSRILPTMAGEGLLRLSNGMVEVSS